MQELIQAGDRTWYLQGPTIIGFYRLNDKEVCVIDTGEGKEDALRIQSVLESRGWELKFILNTHTHIDHLGGNDHLMSLWGCPAYSTNIGNAFANYEDMEAAYMYGGAPCGSLRKVFKHPGPIGFRDIEAFDLPEGMEYIILPGHSFGMIGIRTSDDVWFLGDSVLNSQSLEKYGFGYLVDVQGYLDTLELLEGMEGRLFIPSHGDVTEDIKPLAQGNRENIYKNEAYLLEICKEEKCFDMILKEVMDHYGIRGSIIQYALAGSTLKCYLTWLHDRGKAEYRFCDNLMVWKSK